MSHEYPAPIRPNQDMNTKLDERRRTRAVPLRITSFFMSFSTFKIEVYMRKIDNGILDKERITNSPKPSSYPLPINERANRPARYKIAIEGPRIIADIFRDFFIAGTESTP